MTPAALVALLFAGFALGWFLCSRTQANRLLAAMEVGDITHRASETVLAASNLAPRIDAVTENLKAQADAFGKLADIIDALDQNQAAILNAMERSGMIERTRGNIHARQRGEPETGDRTPPSLELAGEPRPR